MVSKQHAFALALLLASLILISGCTSSKYNPCCVRSELYDETGTALPSPKCYFPNETLFGPCTLDAGVTGAADCTDGTSCASISTEEDCVKTASCNWDEAASPKCTGGQASWLLAICQDSVPKSCVNDKCTAMVCGYSSIRPAPPPASQDWDAEKSAQDYQEDPSKLSNAMPPSSISMPVVNLQGATCDFNKMNKKLYNRMTSSRGGLWVNSFRFGVGSSFSDYEAARNYFPATDRVCAANPYAKTDRFTVYLNTVDTFCQPGAYYTCNKLPSDVSFKDEKNCKLYCGGGVAPYACTLAAGTKYICNADGFAYEEQSTCRQKCSIISDPNACTNDESQFPFLDTDGSLQARYRLKYVSDYMVDTVSPQGSGTCLSYGEPDGSVAFHPWTAYDQSSPPEPIACNDYTEWGDGPWFWSYDCYVGAGCTGASCAACDNVNKMGELRTYFDNHAYSSVDFDYDYYVKNLFEQYQGSPDADGMLQFECKSGSECLSGSCDTTYYKRPMCKDAATELPVACGCSKAQFDSTNTYYPSCNLNGISAMPAYSDTSIPDENVGKPIASDPINNYGPMLYPAQSLHNAAGSATSSFKYYFPAPAGSGKPLLFSICSVAPAQPTPKKMCIMKDKFCVDLGFEEPRIRITQQDVIWEAESDGLCHYSMEDDPLECDITGINGGPGKDYWEYSFNLDANSGTVNKGQFGTCKMNGEVPSKPPTPPYLDTTDLGWCAPCTYATLAVQKVDFGVTTNPGGYGLLRPLSCYEYRGEFNYIQDGQTYPYGGFVGDAPSALYDGALRWGSPTSPSTAIVRRESNPSAYERDTNGNIWQSTTDENYHYQCVDEWHSAGGWWAVPEIPTPSAPYLKEKLTSYLQSNVMPILDEQSSKTSLGAGSPYSCSPAPSTVYKCCYAPGQCKGAYYTSGDACYNGQQCGWPYACSPYPLIGYSEPYACSRDSMIYEGSAYCSEQCLCSENNGEYQCIGGNGVAKYPSAAACVAACSQIPTNYAPIKVCNDYGGDGAVVHAIGDSTMLGAAAGAYGSVAPGGLDYDTRRYVGMSGMPANQPVSLSGSKAIIVRTSLLKKDCDTPPLAGIEIMPTEGAASLIGKGDLSDPNNPDRGKLHKFFYSTTEPGFAYRTANGVPDKVPDNMDMLLLDWYPVCDGQGMLPGENEQYEFESKMEFARAIMANFSKPMLVWKFAFPQNTNCNAAAFLDYMFNNTAAMVDSGLIGVIYSDWMMEDGKGYGPTSRQYSDTASYPTYWGTDVHSWEGPLDTGLTQSLPTVRGSATLTFTLDSPRSMASTDPGKGDLFCALQLYSKRAIGFIPLAYGQKLYAENVTCDCQECSDFDYIAGACDLSAKQNSNNDPELPQIYCNDGTKCAMPSGRSDTSNFRCTDRCMNATACKLCSDSMNNAYSSFCRLTPVGGSTFGTSRCYNNITDDYWEFLAGLSPSEKCCLVSPDADKSDAKYTYTMMTGTKQQAEFLQFPAHGEQNIDCGRSPDTSVLEYCNIRVPISQKEIACMRIDTPLCAVLGGNTPPVNVN